MRLLTGLFQGSGIEKMKDNQTSVDLLSKQLMIPMWDRIKVTNFFLEK